MRRGVSPHVELHTDTHATHVLLVEACDPAPARLCLQRINSLCNPVKGVDVREAGARLVAPHVRAELWRLCHFVGEADASQPHEVDVVCEGLREVVDLDHVAVNLDAVLALRLNLLQGGFVVRALRRHRPQVGDQVRVGDALAGVVGKVALARAKPAALQLDRALKLSTVLASMLTHLDELVRSDRPVPEHLCLPNAQFWEFRIAV